MIRAGQTDSFPPLQTESDARITDFHIAEPNTESEESLAAGLEDFESVLGRHEILSWATEPARRLSFTRLLCTRPRKPQAPCLLYAVRESRCPL